MKRFLYIQITLFSFLTLFASTSFAQTFWGTVPNDGHWGGGAIFSFDAKTDTYTDAYYFKGSPVYDAFNVFEESPNVYIGVCGRSFKDGSVGDLEKGNSIYRYDAISNTTDIIFNYPYDTYHSYAIGEMAYIGNNSIIGLSNVNDSIKLTRYDISTDTYQEFGRFSSKSYPANGDYAYRTNACYFTEISESMVVFSLPKVLGGESSSTTVAGRDFFGYNPQTNEIGLLFNIPSSQPYYPRGPFTQTSDGSIFAPMTGSILEINLADSTYQLEHAFASGYVIDGEMVQATDTTFVGLKNVSESGYLFEYDFKNNLMLTEEYLWQKAQFNAFVQRDDTLYFGGDNDMIFAYKIGSGEAPVVSYTLESENQGYINYLVNSSDESYILSFAAGLHRFYPEKKAYTNLVRFGGTVGGFWDFIEGATPTSELLLASNGKLYGFTVNGGAGAYSSGDGVLFEVDPETKDFQLIHSFVGDNGGFGDRDSYGTYYGKGQNSLTELNQKIYGTTYTNGAYDNHPAPGYGVVFTYDISRDYDNYHVVFNFNDSTEASAGRFPMSGLTLGSNGKLYGTTASGGIGGIYGHGVVYEIDPNDNDQFRIVMKIPDTDLRTIDNLILADNGKLYGLASGAEYNSDPKQWAIREYDVENASYTDLFTSELSEYEYNYSQFTSLNNKLYGVVSQTYYSQGYIFEFDIATQQLVKKVVFTSNSDDGAKPGSNMTLSSSGSFWGMTSSGGVHSDEWGDYNKGVIYEFDPVEGTYTKHYDFGGNGGVNPLYASLTETAGVDYTGIDSPISEERLQAYPNPTTDFVRFNLENNSVQKVDYAVFDIRGKQILSETLDVQNYLILDLSGFKSGTYVVKINTDKQSFSKTIVRN